MGWPNPADPLVGIDLVSRHEGRQWIQRVGRAIQGPGQQLVDRGLLDIGSPNQGHHLGKDGQMLGQGIVVRRLVRGGSGQGPEYDR